MSHAATRFLHETAGIDYLKRYAIPYPAHELARDAAQAAAAAERIGYPVVLKVVSAQLPHKTDVGGVMVGLSGEAQVRAGFEAIGDRAARCAPGAVIEGVMVCAQAAEGLEVIVGGLDDAVFGPTVMFGLGGVFAEVLEDVSFRVVPFAARDARQMIAEIKGFPLLTGARGRPAGDIDRLAELILSVGRMLSEHPEIVELDLNPVRVYARSLLALDVRIKERFEPTARPK